MAALPEYLCAMDVPSIDGLNTWIISRLARHNGMKVVLSGLGGDELLGGYPSYGRIPRLTKMARCLGGSLPLRRIAGAMLERLGCRSRWQRLGDFLRGPPTLSRAYNAYRGVFAPREARRLAAHLSGACEAELAPPAEDADPSLPPHNGDAVSYLELSRYMRNQLLRDRRRHEHGPRFGVEGPFRGSHAVRNARHDPAVDPASARQTPAPGRRTGDPPTSRPGTETRVRLPVRQMARRRLAGGDGNWRNAPAGCHQHLVSAVERLHVPGVARARFGRVRFMRVLHAIPSLSPAHGGPSQALPMMERALSAVGVVVETVTTDDDGRRRRVNKPLGRPLNENGAVRWYFPKQMEFYKVSVPLLRWLPREVRRFDVVHVHALFSFASVAAAWTALRVRPVCHPAARCPEPLRDDPPPRV